MAEDEKMSIDKKESVKDDSEDSMGSSPGEDPPANHHAPQENQQPKRKGGRKPIYATSEERKQRNRQAQAAFRERRTEYIKQLEETIRVHEQNLHNLQSAHRHAADECLMLRYKNSLLERILLEKGIDVQAELRAKTGSPNLGPTHVPQNLVQPPPIQRALLNRHHSRRSNSGIAPKLEPGINVTPLPPPLNSTHSHSTGASPKTRPTPPSHAASPTTTSTFGSQHGTSPATSGSDHLASQIRHPMAAPPPSMKAPPLPVPTLPPMIQGAAAAAAARQIHMARAQVENGTARIHLVFTEQEYDAAADMIDDPGDPPDTPSGPGPYPGAPYAGEPQPMALSSPVTTGPPVSQQLAGHALMETAPPQQQPQPQHGHGHGHGNYPTMTQLLDPALDWDPFGLSASMAFPSHFAFDTSNMR